MSGRKTTYTTISDDELRRIREQAARATSLQESNRLLNQLSAKNDAALAEYRSRIRTLDRNIDSMNRRITEQGEAASREAQELRTRLQQAVRDSNARIQEEARRTDQNLREMHQNFSRALSSTRREFSEALDQTRSDVAEAMDANNRRIENAMRQNNQRLEGEMRNLETRINGEMQEMRSQLDSIEATVSSTAHNQTVLLDMAREYERAADAIIADIQDNYRAELLCPGRLNPVLDSMQSCRSEIRDAEKMPENAATARRDARQALEEAFHLRQDVIRAEQEWNLHFESARQMLGAASVQLEASRELELPDETDVFVDVDAWTAGDLTAIEERLGTLNDQLDNSGELTVSDLDGIQSAGVQISREIDDTSMFAAEAYYASQDRADIAQDITDLLAGMGLVLVDHSYQGNDQRSAHRLHLRNNITEFEIVITQTPVVQADGTIANRLESDIINYGTLNEGRGDEIARDVLSSMRGIGLQQTEVSTVAGYENAPSDRTECVNIQEWRTERATEVARPDHNARGVVCV
jgi:hypothetical protein